MTRPWFFHHEFDGWRLFVLLLGQWHSFSWPHWLKLPR
jgi:hypothetical protein